MKTGITRLASLAALLVTVCLCFSPAMSAGAGERVLIFAAASTAAPVTAAIQAFKLKTGKTVIASFAASSALARQISQGAPANLYISANSGWLDYLEGANLFVPQSRTDLVSNRLVLAAYRSSTEKTSVDLRELPNLLGDQKLAIGDPDHVPAGIYAKAAFESLGLWQVLGGKLVYQVNVSSVLAMLERKEVPYAVVYATDVARSPNTEIAVTFPVSSYPQIRYGMALVKGNDHSLAQQFHTFLKSSDGQGIFEQFGFLSLR